MSLEARAAAAMEEWVAANKAAAEFQAAETASAAKKAAQTKKLEHGDIDQSHLGALGFAFAGDWENGEGTIEASVSYSGAIGKKRRGGKRRNRRG